MMDYFELFGLLLFYVGGAGFAWVSMKLAYKNDAPGIAFIAAIFGITCVVGLALINGTAAFNGGKASPAFLGLYGFIIVGVISLIKTKREARQ
jgi:hypothetical protein